MNQRFVQIEQALRADVLDQGYGRDMRPASKSMPTRSSGNR